MYHLYMLCDALQQFLLTKTMELKIIIIIIINNWIDKHKSYDYYKNNVY